MDSPYVEGMRSELTILRQQASTFFEEALATVIMTRGCGRTNQTHYKPHPVQQ
jgi:hypothetical protein